MQKQKKEKEGLFSYSLLLQINHVYLCRHICLNPTPFIQDSRVSIIRLLGSNNP